MSTRVMTTCIATVVLSGIASAQGLTYDMTMTGTHTDSRGGQSVSRPMMVAHGSSMVIDHTFNRTRPGDNNKGIYMLKVHACNPSCS